MRRVDLPPDRKVWLNVSDIVSLTSLGERAVREMIAAGHLRRIPHTERVLVHRAELDRLAGVEPTTSCGPPAQHRQSGRDVG